jgi:carboxylate-amine ligase
MPMGEQYPFRSGHVRMALEAFNRSEPFTFGVELELQIVNLHDYDLTNASSDLIRLIRERKVPGDIKPEITESMIEIATGICTHFSQARDELRTLRDALVSAADKLNVGLCGGGTHTFQQWNERQIFDAPRFQYLSELYGYLAKQFTIFGQHVHIGCPEADSALFLLHSLSRYIPHFIALSASSPYVQGVDTGFHSARLNSVFAFPMSGRAPFVLTWDSFEEYFSKMVSTGVIGSMKDFYWDIRPKPEFGTIEVRVLDTPLSVDRAAALAAYIQTLARYLGERRMIADDVLATLDRLGPHAEALGSSEALEEIASIARSHINDATWLRETYRQGGSLPEVVRQQCLQWRA